MEVIENSFREQIYLLENFVGHLNCEFLRLFLLDKNTKIILISSSFFFIKPKRKNKTEREKGNFVLLNKNAKGFISMI